MHGIDDIIHLVDDHRARHREDGRLERVQPVITDPLCGGMEAGAGPVGGQLPTIHCLDEIRRDADTELPVCPQDIRHPEVNEQLQARQRKTACQVDRPPPRAVPAPAIPKSSIPGEHVFDGAGVFGRGQPPAMDQVRHTERSVEESANVGGGFVHGLLS